MPITLAGARIGGLLRDRSRSGGIHRCVVAGPGGCSSPSLPTVDPNGTIERIQQSERKAKSIGSDTMTPTLIVPCEERTKRAWLQHLFEQRRRRKKNVLLHWVNTKDYYCQNASRPSRARESWCRHCLECAIRTQNMAPASAGRNLTEAWGASDSTNPPALSGNAANAALRRR